MQIRELGVRLSFVPEDRLGMGLVGNMDIIDNMMLRSYRKGKGAFLRAQEAQDARRKSYKRPRSCNPEREYARAPSLRRQRAEGACRP